MVISNWQTLDSVRRISKSRTSLIRYAAALNTSAQKCWIVGHTQELLTTTKSVRSCTSSWQGYLPTTRATRNKCLLTLPGKMLLTHLTSQQIRNHSWRVCCRKTRRSVWVTKMSLMKSNHTHSSLRLTGVSSCWNRRVARWSHIWVDSTLTRNSSKLSQMNRLKNYMKKMSQARNEDGRELSRMLKRISRT